ncbi:hypothetical protein PTSG_08483 [Salpingoeca rosetta]|uniref:Calponin-homology (CH) domain-containing protein n=1 Tax=Salpingoeca rosetta (strain ATCC 50818 / BSB-021) TaxID=946362 RepID=F2UJT9_SALR5|nr:uncharacterized protein PTSG_08483 [Salpingoeca rosetta]EGD77388.1 hypothetical protein PTSG_08483 [Salpingoeca rosetta]|eukprot:XP_004990732.1 hypothetical protein PTSG_08483 [Salpingoeca rosetta]
MDDCEQVLLDLQQATLALDEQEETSPDVAETMTALGSTVELSSDMLHNANINTNNDTNGNNDIADTDSADTTDTHCNATGAATSTANNDGSKDTTQDAAAELAQLLEHATVMPLDGCYGSTPLDLGSAVMGSTTTRALIVRNTTARPQQVTIERFPFTKGFSLSVLSSSGEREAYDAGSASISFSLDAESEVTLFVGFTAPKTEEARSYRHVASFITGKRSYKLSLQVVATVPLKPKPKRTLRGAVGRTGLTRKHSLRAPLKAVNSANPSRLRTATTAKPQQRQTQRGNAAAAEGEKTMDHKPIKPKAVKMPARKKKASPFADDTTQQESTQEPQVSAPSRFDRQERAYTTWINHVLSPARNVVNMHTERELLKLRSRAKALRASETVSNGLSKLWENIEGGALVAREESCIFLDIHLRDEAVRVFMSFQPEWLRFGLETLFAQPIEVDASNPMSSLKAFVATNVMDNADIKEHYCFPAVPSHLVDEFHTTMANHILFTMIGVVFLVDQARAKSLLPHSPCVFMPATFDSSNAVLAFISNQFLKGEGSLEKHLRYLGLTFSYKQSSLEEYDYEVTNLSTDMRDGVKLWRVLSLMHSSNSSRTALPYTPVVSQNKAVWVKNNKQYLAALKAAGCQQFFPQRAADDLANGHRDVTLSVLWATLVCFRICNPLDEALLLAEIARIKRNPRYKRTDSRRASEAHMYQNSPQVNLLLQWCRAVCMCYDLEVVDFTTSFSDGRALCYLINFYHPQLLQRSAINTSTTATDTKDKTFDARMAAVRESDNGFSCVMSPGVNRVGGRSRQQLLENEKGNYKLISQALKKLGGVPLLAKSKDMCGTVPDERVVISYVSCLCTRLLDINQEQRACLVIQRHWRRFHKRREEELAVVKLQRQWRSVLLMRAQQRAYQQTRTAVIALQSGVRMWRQRCAFQRTMHAIVAVQTCARRWAARRVLAQLKRHHHAAITMQCAARAYIARRRTALLREARDRHRAATCIQRHILTWLARTQHQQRCKAATAVQAVFRGRQARRQAARRRAAILVLQSRVRAVLLGRWIRTAYLQYKAAAVVLQRAWRQRCCLQATRAVCQERRIAATTIQSTWRMWKCKQQRRTRMTALVTLQSFARMFQAQRQLSTLRRERAAAVTLQAAVRGMRARQVLRQTLTRRKETFAAVCIQKHVRGWRARCAFTRTRTATTTIQAALRGTLARKEAQRRRSAIAVLQMHARATLQMRGVRRGFLQFKTAAITLQRQWRLRTEAKHTRQLCVVRRNASVCIQRTWRMRRARSHFLRLRSAAVVLQSAVRATMARQHTAHLRRRQAVVQRVARGLHLNLCAITIQRAFRGFAARKTAAVVLQKHARRHLAQTRFRRTLAAVVCLQRHTRGVATRRAYKAWRAQRLERLTGATRAHLAATMIQRGYRRYRQQTRAAVLMQKTVRGFLARRRFAAVCTSVVRLQCAWRCLQAVREVRRRKEAAERRARVLLLGARMFLSTVTIQRRVRAYQQRQREERAACVIQRHFRVWKKLHSKACREGAATRIQAWFRAYRIRKRMSDRLKRIHQNVMEVNRQYCPEATLGWKTNSALTVLLKYKKVSRVLEALKNLNRMAGLSAECCGRIASHDGLDVIYTLIRSCNRSKPEMAMVVHCLSIIESLLRHDVTCERVMQNLQLGELMFDLTRGYRDNAEIFEPACRLLHRCCQEPSHRERLQKDRSYMKRLASLINMTERKANVFIKAKTSARKEEATSLLELVGLLKDIQRTLNPQEQHN